MKRLIVTLLLIASVFQVEAQDFPSEQWHPGAVQLNNDTYVVGDVKYDLEHDAVQVQVNGKTKTYSSQQVASFKIRPKLQRKFRHFFTLPHVNKTGYKSPRFFEVVIEGTTTLLAREYVTTVSARNNTLRQNRRIGLNDPTNRNLGGYTRTILAHRLYIVNLDGKIHELTGRKKDLFVVLKGHNDDLKKFIKNERIRLDRVNDMARLVGHYNSISTEQSRAY